MLSTVIAHCPPSLRADNVIILIVQVRGWVLCPVSHCWYMLDLRFEYLVESGFETYPSSPISMPSTTVGWNIKALSSILACFRWFLGVLRWGGGS